MYIVVILLAYIVITVHATIVAVVAILLYHKTDFQTMNENGI